MNITGKWEVPIERISDLLCNALEGGSNYWYTITEYIEPPKIEFLSMAGCEIPSVIRHLDYPCNEGGALMLCDLEDESRAPVRLDLSAMQRGLQLMIEKYPWHFADFIRENDDATTGDVFLQLSVFGEVIYS